MCFVFGLFGCSLCVWWGVRGFCVCRCVCVFFLEGGCFFRCVFRVGCCRFGLCLVCYCVDALAGAHCFAFCLFFGSLSVVVCACSWLCLCFCLMCVNVFASVCVCIVCLHCVSCVLCSHCVCLRCACSHLYCIKCECGFACFFCVLAWKTIQCKQNPR